MGETFVTSFNTVLTQIGDFVDAAIGWAETFLSVISSEPVLFLFVIAVPLVGIGAGLLNRLIRSN